MSSELLAINGGKPTLKLRELEWPIATDPIKANVEIAMRDGSWGKYEGRWTDELIEKLKSVFQSDLVTLCSSGTIAVEMALRGVGIQPEDEVILAAYDFPGNFRAIEAIGARPVLVDVVADGWVMDPDHIAEAITDQTSAIVVSHLHGQVADIQGIRAIINSHNDASEKQIKLVEDACQTPGGSLKIETDGKPINRPLGSLGDVGVLSFGGSKLLSAGRGGAVLTNDPSVHQRAKIYANRGNDAFPLSQLQAAVLTPQLETLDMFTKQRAENATLLIRQTETLNLLKSQTQKVSGATPAFYKLPWLLRDRTPGWARTDFIAAMIAEGVPVGEGFRGFLRRSPRRCRKIGTLVNSQIAAQQTVLLQHPMLLQPATIMDDIFRAFEKVLNCPG